MDQSDISLKEVERKAFRSMYQDGLWDITWGIWLFAWAFIPLLESWGVSRYWGYPILLLPVLIIWLGKQHITVPRIGSAKFGAERRQRRQRLFMVVAFFLCLMWVLAMVITWTGLAMGLAVTLLLAAVAYLMDFQRMYIYAVLMGVGIPVARSLDRFVGDPLNNVIVFGIPSAIIITYGLILLVKFIVHYPKVNAETANGYR